jgi:hypothetical protein
MTANRLANQKLDALDFLIDPMIVASSTSGINTQNLFTRAGNKVILVDGAADDSRLGPLSGYARSSGRIHGDRPAFQHDAARNRRD